MGNGKTFFLSKGIARTIALSNTARLYFEHITKILHDPIRAIRDWACLGKTIVPIVEERRSLNMEEGTY